MPLPAPKLRQWILVTGFLVGICLPLLGTMFHWGISRASEEQRALAGPPPIALFWRAPTRFYARLKDFLTDGFGFRGPLVRLHAGFMVRRLGVSPNLKVVLGRQGWLFYAGDQCMDDYTCITPFTPVQLDQWRTLLERRRDWLAAQGIGYVFMVAPNAQTIYPEYLPAGIRRAGTVSRLDQLLARLRASASPIQVVDLRPALDAAKGRERVYFMTDTHWNQRGALVASRELLARIPVPGLQLPEIGQFQVTEIAGPGGDLARMLGLGDSMPETRTELTPRVPRDLLWHRGPVGLPQIVSSHHQANRGPGLLVFHDSFGTAMQPFLAEAFGRATFVLNAGPAFDPGLVASARPDVVVQELVERGLMNDPAPYLVKGP